MTQRPSSQRTEDLYVRQLMQLELAVVALYEQNPDLTDAQLDSAYEELARRYRAEATAHPFKPGKLDGLRLSAHDALLPVAEMLRGRPAPLAGTPVISAEELRVCLNRLRASIRTWSREGRTAYLRFLSSQLG